jgi:hypothetical protein
LLNEDHQSKLIYFQLLHLGANGPHKPKTTWRPATP